MGLNYSYVEKTLVEWLRDRVEQAGAAGAAVGLSGGIDSAVTSVLCKKAFGDNVLGVIMPCHSRAEDADDARLVAEKFSIDYINRDLGPVFDKFLDILDAEKDGGLAVANMKPRLRMTALYYYAAEKNYLVIGTDNWSELKVGYFTKYGDGGIDLAPLGRLVKTEVRQLAAHLGIPDKIINKAPSAGLWQGQTDEEEMGISYSELDHYILTGEASPEVRERIEELAAKSAHKLETIPIPSRQNIVLPSET